MDTPRLRAQNRSRGGGQPVKASWLLARADLRRRWPAVVALAVLAGLAGGFVLTALLGARRSASAWERFRAETLADDAFVSIPSRPDPEVADELAAMPDVVDATSFVYLAVTLPGVPEGGAFAAADDRLTRTVQRGRLVEGRRFDPSKTDEILVNPAMASAAGVRSGQRVTLHGVGEDTFSTEVTVVGVVLTANDLALNTGFPAAVLTPAFFRAHADDVQAGRVNQFVRLRHGTAGVPSFRERVVERYGAEGGVLVGDSNQEASGVRNALRLQATALGVLAAVAAVATVLAVGQALARHIAHAATDAPALRALGMTRPERTSALGAPVVVVAVAGAALAAAVAVAASPLVPTGLARQVESETGVKFDVVTMVGGGTVLAALLAAAGWGPARRAARTRGTAPSLRPARGTGIPLGPAATVGLTTALGGGGARTRGAARSAIAAACVGTLGVTAAVTFGASLDHLLETPRLYGWDFDAVAGIGGDDPSRIDEAVAGLASDPDVTRLAAHELDFLTIGDQTVETFVLRQEKGAAILPTLASGRAPTGPDEIILGSTTMANLGARLGDRVEAVGTEGPVQLTVVGQGVFPALGDGSTTHAAAVPAGAAAALRLEESRGRLVLVAVRPGADAVAVARRHTDLPVSPPVPPSELENLRLVGSTPWLLAAFLAALAITAVGHAVVVSVRAGARDLAVLRTLGFVRRQVRGTVQWQASAMVGVGLVAGIPLGLAAGRWIWRLAVRSTGALVEPVTAAAIVAAMVPLALLLANLTAAVPARAAARMRPAEVLRTE
jgi:ABC-type lipoprotein release transport system permease subunit